MPIPALQLTVKVVVRIAEIAEADRLPVDGMQAGQCVRHRHEHCRALRRRNARQRRFGEDPSFDAVHEIERRANHLRIVDISENGRHGHRSLRQGPHDAGLPVDRVCGGQEGSRRLLAQHHATVVKSDKERRIRLTAMHAVQPHLPSKLGDQAAQTAFESERIKLRGSRVHCPALSPIHSVCAHWGMVHATRPKGASQFIDILMAIFLLSVK
ncbi:hypothetical protein D9M72_466430 [compost metagenome]